MSTTKSRGAPEWAERAIKPGAGRLPVAASTLPPAPSLPRPAPPHPAARKPSREPIEKPAPLAMASEPVIGKLSVRVVRGANLVIADPLTHTSDPFVVLCYGSQKVKTSVQKKNANPLWNEVLLLPITNPTKPVKLEVFDEDKFTADDSMGVAEFNVTDIYDAAKLDLKHASDGTRIKTIYPVGTNYLGGESHVLWKNGKVVQDLILKLKNVDSGSLVLQLEWVHVPGVML